MKTLGILCITLFLIFSQNISFANDGYGLWLNYFPVSENLQKDYNDQIKSLEVVGNNPTIEIVKSELIKGLTSLLGTQISANGKGQNGTIIAAKFADLPVKNNEKKPEKKAF